MVRWATCWISRIHSHHDFSRYRVSINTLAGKHFDFQVVIREDMDEMIAKYGVERRTAITDDASEVRMEDLIADDELIEVG